MYLSDRGLISRIYKKQSQKSNDPVLKKARDLNREFSKQQQEKNKTGLEISQNHLSFLAIVKMQVKINLKV